MTFKGPYDVDPLDRSVLVLQDKTEDSFSGHYSSMYFSNINYCFQLLYNVRVGIDRLISL